MVAAGAIAGLAAMFSMHMDPSRAVGRIGVRPGVFTANCDSLHITVHGRGGHAARPHDTIDPIAAAAQLIGALYAHVPRAIDSQDAVVVTIGQIAGGQNDNVIPDRVDLGGTLRTLDSRVRQRALEQIERIAQGIAAISGTKIEVLVVGGIMSVVNDAHVTDLVRQAGTAVLGEEQIDEIPRPSMGSEDFAAYLDHVPGSMFRLGCASATAGNSALHTPTFDVDERALTIGAKILAHAAILRSQPAA
jgi:amidohydrolase